MGAPRRYRWSSVVRVMRRRRRLKDAAGKRPSPGRLAAGAASGVASSAHGAAASRPRSSACPRSLPGRRDARSSSSSQVRGIVCAAEATSKAGSLPSRRCPPLPSREEPPEPGVEPASVAVCSGSLRAELADCHPWADVRGLVHERVIPHRLERWRALRGSAGRHELCSVEVSAGASRPRRWRSRRYPLVHLPAHVGRQVGRQSRGVVMRHRRSSIRRRPSSMPGR